MSLFTKCSKLMLIPLLGFFLLSYQPALSAENVTLYTPFTKISVPPGESLTYNIEIKNNSDQIKNVPVYLSGMPEGWNYDLTSAGLKVMQISVRPGGMNKLTLKVDIPLKVDKGDYRFRVVARGFDVLPLVVNVSEKGTYKSEFTTEQANMEGHAGSAFTYRTTLKNLTAEKQLYSLRARAPRGWRVTFKPSHKQATSVEIEANSSKDINIEIKPPERIEEGTYKIPVTASTNTTSAGLELEAVVTGTYEMTLTTPKGLLSTRITAGDEKRLELIVKNTGSATLTDITMSAASPSNWDVVFDAAEIDTLDVGKNASVYATIKADRKAIAGDYVTNFTARTPEVSSKASFRISVKTPMLWGWVGIIIILIAIGGVYYLFRKYGRR